LLKPAKKTGGPLGKLYGAFNAVFERTTKGYVNVSRTSCGAASSPS